MKKVFTLIAIVMIALSANADPNVTINNIPSTYNGCRNYVQAVLTDTLKTDDKVERTPDVNYDGKVDSQDVLKVYDYTKTATDTHEYVDLGLPSGTLWATCNVGAENCYDYGDYFAWGETTGYDEGKTTFSWSTYTLCQGSSTTMTKYFTDSSYGTVDNKTVLEASDDAATANWGSAWRMPTYAELSELKNTNNCSWTWYAAGNTEFHGVAGYKVQSLIAGYTDKYIFLPAAGYRDDSSLSNAGTRGGYWSSSLNEGYSDFARSLYFNISYRDVGSNYRYYGRSVRPVRVINKKKVEITPDVNYDGKVDSQDVLKVYDYMKTSTEAPTESTRQDVNHDGKVDSQDILAIYEYMKNAPETHEYVEIGGVKWATMNLGATTVAGNPATCYGDYYAWGETEPRYTSITISGDGTSATFGGWSSSHSSGYSSSDYPSYTGETLDAAHDAATQNWGSDWRIPTHEEYVKLYEACGGTGDLINSTLPIGTTSTTAKGIYWCNDYDGVKGLLFSDGTNKVFFPAAGECYNTSFVGGGSRSGYWSSSLDTSYTSSAYLLNFFSSCVGPSFCSNRFYSNMIRPVRVQ